MKILVIGHYSRDVVHEQDGRVVEREGGLYHCISMLSALAEKQDRIIPVTPVPSGEFAEISRRFADLPGIDGSAIFSVNAPVHRVEYYPAADGSRVACVKEMAPPIPFERFKKYLDAEAVLVNMLSGTDLTIETMDELRMAVRGEDTKIHFDFHNLTLSVGKEGERVRRPLSTWRRWAFMVDTVQLNEQELRGLSVEPMSEAQTVGHLLTLGVKGVIVTRGFRGATLFSNEHKKVVRRESVPVVGGEYSRPLPAGDIFGGAFLAAYVRSGDPGEALDVAVRDTAERLNHIASDPG
jgi:hypothetical protein